MKYQELNKQIKAGEFARIYLFCGKETHIAGMMEKRLIGAAVAPGMEQLNMEVFSDREITAADIIDSARQLPMMSPYRVVIVREQTGILTRGDKETEEILGAYIKSPEPQTILIFHAEAVDKRRKLGKTLSAAAAVVSFDKLTEEELTKWIVRRVEQGGKTITRRGVAAIIERTMYLTSDDVGTAMIDTEIGKLIDFAGASGRITPESVERVLTEAVDDNVYHMIDAAVAGRTGEALIMLKNFYLRGESPLRLFGLIVSQCRLMTQIAELAKKGQGNAAIAKAVRRPGFVIRKMMPVVKRLGADALEEMMIALAKWDVEMKTGAVDPALAVELWLTRLAG